MAKKSKNKKKYRSKIPPPSWDQVAWLMGCGAVQILLTVLMTFYNMRIEDKTNLSEFDEFFGSAYSVMIFLGIISVSALILGLWKTFLLLRMRFKAKRTG